MRKYIKVFTKGVSVGHQILLSIWFSPSCQPAFTPCWFHLAFAYSLIICIFVSELRICYERSPHQVKTLPSPVPFRPFRRKGGKGFLSILSAFLAPAACFPHSEIQIQDNLSSYYKLCNFSANKCNMPQGQGNLGRKVLTTINKQRCWS